VSPILNKSTSSLPRGGRPPAAIEVSPDGVLAAALPGRGQPPVYAFVALPLGALMPGIGEPNLRAPEAVAEAIRAVLADIAPRTRAVTLVLPDTAVRVFVLDFDSLPSKTAEAVPVLRFRLRKMVPFDVEHAGISYQVLSETRSECRVLVAVLPGPILDEYESAVRSAGYEPGAVLSSSLAALAALDSSEPVLAACLNGLSLTTSIASGQDLLLYRTLDLPADPQQRLQEVQRDIAVAAAYFEDKLSARPQRLHYAGDGSAQEFARWINEPALAVVELAPPPATGATTTLGKMSLAGITGALAGAA
jgi:type IV pilus assembly protein PilM